MNPYMQKFGPVQGVYVNEAGDVVGPALFDPTLLPDEIPITYKGILHQREKRRQIESYYYEKRKQKKA